ncbi:hypothetical protein WH47_03622 [Habropoda laboriosa]|uniref:Tubulin epsilon and delta complex protein 1 domain-containing protein n=1 Tax=Habropoda laboriosa TaxID=597456 RepID=A0A0L7RIP5_9HYME|nr:hypothetical protein WH47_03622 [Habropoda laboriosa]
MSDIKSVLSLLCQHLNASINVTMKPEYFRLAKFNSTAENVREVFWKALNILSYHAVKEKIIAADFEQFDIVWATKLYFAYLQYPAVEFYALSAESKNNRPLLLAFAWLLGTENILSIIVQLKLSNSVLGKEFSYANNSEKEEIEYNVPESIPAQINHVLYLSGKVNYNIKQISELVSERTKLVNKAHAASKNYSGLPHLSVSELALVKRISTVNKNLPSDEDKKYIKELSATASLLDIHMKWLKKEHIFFEWMVTVVEEHNKSMSTSLQDIDWNEATKFVSLLDYMTQERLKVLSSKERCKDSPNYEPNCIERMLRLQGDDAEMEKWLTEISAELDKETEDLTKKKEMLSKKLKDILKSIPSCVQVPYS